MTNQPKQVPFIHLLLPILFLTVLIVYGLILQPRLFNQPAFPLEIVFLLATIFSAGHLLLLGYSWQVIQDAIVAKLAKGFPAILILFAIGLVIGTWIISGTIPMLVYYGIKIISPSYIYAIAFFVPIIFSTLTGTSWGSVGTIGTVIMGVAISVDANLGITAGAIVGGAYFGDKLSPLSDTTNLAALAAEVDLYDHIRSMMYTTLPAAALAMIAYFILGFLYAPNASAATNATSQETLSAINAMFHFNILLLIPPVIVLYGSLKRYAPLPTLLASCVVACLLALLFQDFGISAVFATLRDGFNHNMAIGVSEVPVRVQDLFNRGGLYQLNDVIVFTLMALTFIGSLDVTDAMPKIVNRVFGFTKTKASIVIATLFSTAFTNAMTSNQSATSFIIGDAYKKRYDSLGLSRLVLSRSIEDYGTMIESIIPWTSTALFMVATLGVPFSDYWHWQLLSLINLIIAPLWAILGIGLFDKEDGLR